jgi:hypothetical protein
MISIAALDDIEFEIYSAEEYKQIHVGVQQQVTPTMEPTSLTTV